jgi:hypothetical protein
MKNQFHLHEQKKIKMTTPEMDDVKIKEMFDLFDADGGGSIDTEELARVHGVLPVVSGRFTFQRSVVRFRSHSCLSNWKFVKDCELDLPSLDLPSLPSIAPNSWSFVDLGEDSRLRVQ